MLRLAVASALFVAVVPLAAQNDPVDWFAKIEQENRLVTLQWQRAADGALQWKNPTIEGSAFRPLFATGLIDLPVGWAPFSLLLHRGDVLSLTGGEFHLQRLGTATTTPELLRFVLRPPADKLADLDELDRLVAIDLLRERNDEATGKALAQIAADKKLSGPLRVRAVPAATARQRFDPATLPLPADADLLLVLDNATAFDAQPLMRINYLTGLVSSARVLSTLKAPTAEDLEIGQSESEMVTELAFEVARQMGNFRIDQTCVAVKVADDGSEPEAVAVVAAGQFDPAHVDRGLRAMAMPDVKSAAEAAATKVAFPGGHAVVTTTQMDLGADGWDRKPAPELAQVLLQPVGTVTPTLRILAPTGSRLLPLLEQIGFAGVARAELTLVVGPERLEIAGVFDAADAAAAERLAKTAQEGLAAMIENPLVAPDLVIAADGTKVRVTASLPRAKLPTFAQTRTVILGMFRR